MECASVPQAAGFADIAAHDGIPAVRMEVRDRAVSRRIGLSAGWLLAGSAIYSGCQWAVLIALARLGSPQLVGEFTLGLAISAPIFLLAQLQLRGLQATDAKNEFAFGDYLALRLLSTALALALVAGGAVYIGGRTGVTLTIVFIAAAKALDSLSDVMFGQWQKAECVGAVSAAMSVNGVASLAGVAAGLLWKRSGPVAAAAYAAGSALSLAFVVAMHSRTGPRASLRPRWHRERLRSLATVALPLGFVLMVVSLNSNVPRFILAKVSGTRELGVFAAVSYFMVAGSTVVNAVGQAISPMLARLHARGDAARYVRALQLYAGLAAVLGIVGVVGAWLFGGAILQLIYSAEYSRQPALLTIVMSAAGVSYVASILGYGMTAGRCFKRQVPLAVSVAVATTSCALVLVPRFGATGAAWSLVCGSAAQAIGSLLVLRWHHRAVIEAGR
jgi:O-antigen/teichoic acid export membrane protein